MNSEDNVAFDQPDQILPNGMEIGSYTVIEKIGQGGMCEVYRALDPGLNRYVALKIMLQQLETEEEISDFFEEGRILARFNHTNIVPVYSVGIEQGLPWLAMAYIEGQNLIDHIMDGHPFTVDDARFFMDQATAALEYAGRSNVIHLDIKPANFMVDTKGVYHLADFGLARRIDSTAHEGQPAKGTPAYASPEHFLRGKLDQRTDIYSLGVTLFHLLTKKVPFPGETALEICSMHLRSPFPTKILVDESIPSGWRNLITKMVEKKPRDRFQNYEELRRALDTIDRFTYVKSSTNPSDEDEAESRRSIPQSGGNPEDLFYLIPGNLLEQSAQLFRIGTPYTEKSVLQGFGTRQSVLLLNNVAEKCRPNQSEKERLDEVLLAIAKVSGYRESLYRIAQFMAEHSGTELRTDKQAIEFVGLERAHHLAQIGFGLNTRWQAEMLLNHHNFWEQAIYTGLLSELMLDMLGYPLTGHEFLCGLFHNIGRLVFMELYPAKNVALWLEAYERNKPLEELEQAHYGLASAKMGAIWLTANQFDPVICFVVANLANPQNCYKSLIALHKPGFLQKSAYNENDVHILAHVTASSALLVRELGLGFSGCSYMDSVHWVDHKATKLLFSNRPNRKVSMDDFSDFFLHTCRSLPELPILRLALAETAHQKNLHYEATWLKNRGMATH